MPLAIDYFVNFYSCEVEMIILTHILYKPSVFAYGGLLSAQAGTSCLAKNKVVIGSWLPTVGEEALPSSRYASTFPFGHGLRQTCLFCCLPFKLILFVFKYNCSCEIFWEILQSYNMFYSVYTSFYSLFLLA